MRLLYVALTRARVVAGEPGLARDIEAFRADFIARPRDAGQMAQLEA